jgi:molybdopterin/thiamine biosynthesis adenylyltransferase
LKLRFSGLKWAKKVKELNVLIVGAGGIGSWTALLLSRAGFHSITVMDDDHVEPHNIGGQFYRVEDIGFPKVTALEFALKNYSNYDINPVICRFNDSTMVRHYDIVIAAVDNISTRASIASRLKATHNGKAFFVDGRLLAEFYHVISFNIMDDNFFDKYKTECIFEEGESAEVACTSKATSYYGAGIAFEIHKRIVCWIENEYCGQENDIPFDKINENMDFIPFTGRKLYANIYLDDRAGLSAAYNILSKTLELIKLLN